MTASAHGIAGAARLGLMHCQPLREMLLCPQVGLDLVRQIVSNDEHAVNGQWYVSLSNGTNHFNTSLWDSWSASPAVTWIDLQIGDFNGDGKDDIAERYQQGGLWYVGLSNGSKFTTSLWDAWPTSANWTDVRLMKSV